MIGHLLRISLRVVSWQDLLSMLHGKEVLNREKKQMILDLLHAGYCLTFISWSRVVSFSALLVLRSGGEIIGGGGIIVSSSVLTVTGRLYR